ncbi:hypothetical protein Tco_0010027 [Tanacetum coccineum]
MEKQEKTKSKSKPKPEKVNRKSTQVNPEAKSQRNISLGTELNASDDDSEDVLVHQVVSMKKMSEKPGHVRPANGFYDKLNAMMFVPQKELSGDQVYWLSAKETASQASKPTTPATPFVHKSRPPSQVLASLQQVNAVFHQFEGIIKAT